MAGLYKTLIILRDYLPEIVVGGGWAPFLYDRYLFKNRHSEPVFTRDIDFMVKPKIPIIGQKTVDRLLVEAGLRAKFKSRENPPVIHYEGTIEGAVITGMIWSGIFQNFAENMQDGIGPSWQIWVSFSKGLDPKVFCLLPSNDHPMRTWG